jgi:membrane protease YdiL (CAAX protease family)
MLLAVPVILWTVQTAFLVVLGLPVRWRIDSRGAPRVLRSAGRISTQACLLIALCLYPVLTGRPIVGYYASLLPATATRWHFVQGVAAAVLCLSLLFLAWVVSGRIQVLLHHSRRKCVRRMALLVPTAFFGAFVEELFFRGVIMADLLRTGVLSPMLVLILNSLVFAAAHYVRGVKRRWTFAGHFFLGFLLSLAFFRTGRLWLPCGLHVGGILAIMGTRPFFRYQGPAWLTGASIFPFAGVVGVAGLAVLTLFVLKYDAAP